MGEVTEGNVVGNRTKTLILLPFLAYYGSPSIINKFVVLRYKRAISGSVMSHHCQSANPVMTRMLIQIPSCHHRYMRNICAVILNMQFSANTWSQTS